ncbi:MAG: IS4 family transposase, partial [Alphaproteobacteria bacterium]
MSQILPDFPRWGARIDSSVNLFFKNFELPALARLCGFRKARGFACIDILLFMIDCVFTGKNLSAIDANGSLPCNRSTCYRFLANPDFNWRRLVLMFALKIRTFFMNLNDAPGRTDVLIVDDTLYERGRSKKVELLSRKHDHNKKVSVLGFEMLTIGWSDGRSFLPMAFSLLSSQLGKHRLCEANNNIDKRTLAGKLRNEAVSGKPTVLVSLLEMLQRAGVKTRHILFDSWFSSRKLLEKLMDMDFRPICMVKEWKGAYFTYEGKSVTIRQLYSEVKERLCFSKAEDGRLGSVLVGLGKDENGSPRLGRVIFVRKRGKGRKWLALLNTDVAITDAESVRLYGIRWGIEVFFKVCKSVLKLSKEYQVRSYDALVGQASLV